jgi:hypothetical protein
MKLYTRDECGIYNGDITVTDRMAPIPSRAVPVAPPTLSGAEVARWVGGGWEVLAERPALQVAAPTIADYERAVQGHLDAAAQAAGYDDMISACSYAGAANAYQAESQKFITWRADVWVYCNKQMADVQSGARPAPTVDELIAELPLLPA